MDLRTTVKTEAIYGFQCDLCHKNFQHTFYDGLDKMEWSTKACIYWNHPDGGLVTADLCSKCFETIRKVMEAMGGTFHDL